MENELIEKIKSCRDNTYYGDLGIENMIVNGVYLFRKISSLNNAEYELNDDDKTKGVIKIKSFHFNHNDMLVYYEDFFTSRALKEIFTLWKENKFLDRYTSNGYGTAIVIPFDSHKKMNEFEQVIKNIKYTTQSEKDFDSVLKKIKYI